MSLPKKVHGVYREPETHWVGDGFPVRTILSHQKLATDISPFLLLDHAGPKDFPPATQPRGVDEHPHRGFETVTIVYQGELEHRDSGGNSGSIGPGDVQWMTAASGVVHEEKHSRAFTERGGTLEMAQLWVNLPAKVKMSPPRYQTLRNRDIPAVDLRGGGGAARVIAGELHGRKGPAQTFTPVNVWDVRLKSGHEAAFELRHDFNTAVVILKGKLTVNGSEMAGAAELVLFEREGVQIGLQAHEDSTLLLLDGQPIEEPIASYGPFVMNTQEEIRQAMDDYRSGKMGTLDIRIKSRRASRP
ncbi:MAG: pirin family protein [Verrucomicrobiales bacterium]|nr:pirin family protein [Verrucomicrobiales bacterium]